MIVNAAAGTRTNAPSWLAARSGVANSPKRDSRTRLPGWALGSWHLLKAPVAGDFFYPVTVNRTHRRVIGWHQSLLNQASNPFHSELERQAMMLLDLMADVASFSSQSHRLSYDFDGRECSYTPDIRSILSSGRSLYLEVKPIQHYAFAENVQRTIAIEQAIRAAGASFRILTDKCLFRQPRKGNIEQLQIYRSIEPDPITAHRIKFFLTKHKVSTIRELGGLSPDRILGHETVMSLILRRSLSVDLNAMLNDTTMVRLPHPSNAQELPHA